MTKNILIVTGVIIIILAVVYFFGSWGKTGKSFKPGGLFPEGAPVLKEPIGLKIETLDQGAGEGAKAGDTITVHYTGTLASGKKFDSSLDRGEPFSFPLGGGMVIQGWEQGLLGMKKGEKRRLTIPPELGYGSTGVGSTIPSNATLIFEIEMLKIN